MFKQTHLNYVHICPVDHEYYTHVCKSPMYTLQLLEAKFEAGNGLDINYTVFAQTVDDEYTGQAVEIEQPEQ